MLLLRDAISKIVDNLFFDSPHDFILIGDFFRICLSVGNLSSNISKKRSKIAFPAFGCNCWKITDFINDW